MIKKTLKFVVDRLGYQIKAKSAPLDDRPIGNMGFLLEDLKQRGLHCNSIFDVGANRTSWSTLALEVFSEAIFTLIEPQHEMIPHLQRFCEINQIHKYYLAGAAAKKGSSIITIWDDLAGSSFLPDKNESLVESGKQRKVDIILSLIHI